MTDQAGAVETSASRLARLRELEQAATGGEWGVDSSQGLCFFGPQHVIVGETGAVSNPSCKADATFIAEARNALPALIAVAEAARAALDNLEGAE